MSAADDWNFITYSPVPEDIKAQLKSAHPYLVRMSSAKGLTEHERAAHGFAAGFFRGISWALFSKMKVSDPWIAAKVQPEKEGKYLVMKVVGKEVVVDVGTWSGKWLDKNVLCWKNLPKKSKKFFNLWRSKKKEKKRE